MKTTKLLLILLLPLIFWQGTKGQGYEFAPIGATWYYSLANYSIPYPYTLLKYVKIISIGDTILGGKTCRILEEYRTPLGNFNNNLYLSNTHFICSENDKVYYYDQNTESFDVLYDFSKIQGEYWLSYLWGNSPNCDTVRVDAVGDTIINGHNLRTLRISQNNCLAGFFFNDYPILEVIGHLHYLFPQADFPLEGPLRCYEDSIIGFFNTGIAPSCDYIGFASIGDFKKENKINIFPNPFSEVFYIEFFNAPKLRNIKIFDLLGNSIYEKINNENMNVIGINLNHLMDGIYIISINGKYFKIIKQS